MKMYFKLCILLSLASLTACSCIQNKTTREPLNRDIAALWSVRIANSVLAKSDSLVFYNGKKPKWTYDLAFLGQAMDKLGDFDTIFSQYAKAYIDYFVQEDGTVKGYKYSDFNLDNINPAKHLMTLYKRTGEEKYRIAIDSFYHQVLEQPRTKEGGFWHKQIYPWQMWLDGIYMASPFIAQYAREFNKPELFDLATHQVKLIYEKTLDPATGLLYHAWDESREQRWCNKATGQSKHFWSRAMGWYLMAIVDILDYLPENHRDREELIGILNKVCSALEKVKDPKTGLWYQVLDQGGREGNYLEGSGSAMYIYCFAKGARKGYLPAKYLSYAEKSFDSMVKVLVLEGKDGLPVFTNICGGCGLGGNPYREGDYNYYVNEKKVDNDQKGVAAFILAALELKK